MGNQEYATIVSSRYRSSLRGVYAYATNRLVVMMIIMVGLWALIPPEGSRPIAEESTATEPNSRGDENKLKVEEV